MEKRTLKVNNEWQDNCIYEAECDRFEVYEKDCTKVSGSKYLQYYWGTEKRNEMPIAIHIVGKKNITLDFKGATLYLHGQIQPFMIENCQNVSIKNCVVEYDRASYTETEILEIGDGFVRVKPLEKYPCRVEDGNLIFTSDTWESVNVPTPIFFMAYDKTTRKGLGSPLATIGKDLKVPEGFPYFYHQFSQVESDADTIVLKGKPCPGCWHVGDIMAIHHEERWLSAITLRDTENINIENFRILNGFGMGILPIHCKNVYIKGLIATFDQMSHGIVTNGADVIHAISCWGDIVVEDSIIEGMMDDSINVHSNFCVVEKAQEKSLQVTLPEICVNRYTYNFNVGESLAIYNGLTMEKTGEYTLLSIDWLDEKRAIFTVDKQITAHKKGDVIENLSTQPNVTVKNCKIGKAVTHMRLQTRGKVVVENNEIELKILLSGDMSYWFESSPINDLTIKNNKFILERAQIFAVPEFFPTEKAPYYHENIKIIDNEFVNENPIVFKMANNITFTGNKNASGKQMTLTLVNCGEVVADDCLLERQTQKKESLSRG